MSEFTDGAERLDIELVRTVISLDEEQLQNIIESIQRERKLVDAIKQLVKAGQKILEIEDIYGIESNLEQWKRDIPEGNVVIDEDAIVCTGAKIHFNSEHPTLVSANRHKFNFHVEAFSLTDPRVVISGEAESVEDAESRELEPVSMFACIVDTTQPVQEIDVHILRFVRKVWDEESEAEKNLVSNLIEDLEHPTQAAA